MKNKVQDQKRPTGTRTKLGLELEESGKELLAHLRGDAKLSRRRIVLPAMRMSGTDANQDVAREIRPRLLHKSQKASRMGTGAQETECDLSRLSGCDPENRRAVLS